MRLVLWRLGAAIAVLLGTLATTFFALMFSGGDPAQAILGTEESAVSKEVLDQIRHEYGLDLPVHQQFWNYVVRLSHGDLGESYLLRVPVKRAIGDQIGATIELALWAGGSALLLSIAVAVLTAKRKPWVAALSSGTERTLSSIPSFVLGLFLLLVFSFQLKILPAVGQQGWKSMILPVVTLAVPTAAVLTQVLRSELEDILEQPFIVMARARGLTEAGVRLGHALRHTLIPLITLSGFVFASLLGGAVLAENLFARQGIGRLISEAANGKDVPMVLGITLLAAATYLVINLLVDLLNAIIDPRIAARS
ncbi:ABC transporter permease [Xylophilus sp.]|uniref:ABC transporter permease n=1 Tax=Xylophilus sp. TaxID=2653893 RepID=UPI002D7E5907|nr:ABC transporter permease [Xylophilus sp.]